MCNEPDFDLPESFVEKIRRNTNREGAALEIHLAPESEALVRKIATQAGLVPEAVAIALLEEGIAALKDKGILF